MISHLYLRSGVPVYWQIVELVKAAVAGGELRDGDPLPSVRVLAEELTDILAGRITVFKQKQSKRNGNDENTNKP